MADLDEFQPTPVSFGRRGKVVTPSDTTDLPGGPVKAVVLTTNGDVSVIPADNPDDEPITFFDGYVGFMPPFMVRRVMASGTSATVATVED